MAKQKIVTRKERLNSVDEAKKRQDKTRAIKLRKQRKQKSLNQKP